MNYLLIKREGPDVRGVLLRSARESADALLRVGL
jgi:hypothetical protein